MPDHLCPACGGPGDSWPHGLCQDCWEDWCDSEFFDSEAGLLPPSEERWEVWLKKRREEVEQMLEV